MSLKKHIKEFAKIATAQELLKACKLCQASGPKDCDSCPYQEYENCLELDSSILLDTLKEVIKLQEENKSLANTNTALYDALIKTPTDFWHAHNEYLKEVENNLNNQIRKYLNTLDSTGLVTQTELNLIIKKVIESGYVEIL